MNAVAIRASIAEISAHRTQAIELFGAAWDAITEGARAAAKAAPSGTFELPILAPRGQWAAHSREDFLADVTKRIDRGVWSHLLQATNLERLMDRTARDQFRAQLAEDPPPATAENCYATLSQLVADADMIFKRGIASAFAKLDRRFRTHDGFKIGSKVILSHAFGEHGLWSFYGRQDETLRDVERTFLTLDGKPHPERSGGIIGVIDAERVGFRLAAFEVEDDYFRVRVFKNGNLHLWFKRRDLVEKVNQLLADHYGASLGAAPDVADVRHAPKTGMAKGYGFFETPDPVRWRVYELAGIITREECSNGYAIEPLSILEPSAGRGALAATAARSGHLVSCIEVQSQHAQALREAGIFAQVKQADFLLEEPSPQFDVVIMNPPFDGGRDIDHVTHALGFVRPGGRLVAVMSAGVEFREDRKTTDFRALVQRFGGLFNDLPPGSFSASGTMVNTVTVSIRKR